jgi:hypothetical protein
MQSPVGIYLDTVTASEIGEFLFCPESWRLAALGHQTANQPARDQGTRHQKRGKGSGAERKGVRSRSQGMVKEFRMKTDPRKGITRELEGKTALVTGASRGLGAAIATSLGQRGALVAVNTFGSPDKAGNQGGHSAFLGRKQNVPLDSGRFFRSVCGLSELCQGLLVQP